MHSTEKISVIIPVYNAEKYLEKSVRSVIEQTYGNLEIICVNDGSTDGSAEILSRLQAEDPKVVVVDKANGGLGDARNAGLAVATSEWISFLDSDDFLCADAFESISAVFPENPDLICFGTRIVTEDGSEPSLSDRKYYAVRFSGNVEINDSVIQKTDGSVCNKMFRKSILDSNGIRFARIYYEDFVFTMQYFFCIRQAYYFKDKFYNYLRHSGSIMTTTFVRTPRAIDHLRGIGYLFAFVVDKGLHKSHEIMLSHIFVSYYWLSVKYSVQEKQEEIVGCAAEIYDKYDFLRQHVSRKLVNRTVCYEMKSRRHLVSGLLQILFCARREYFHYRQYKVVRLFNLIVYKKLIPEA